jgi:cytochrome c556
MIRSMCAVASIAAVALGVSIAVAQQDVIKERKDIMKGNGDEAKIGAAMVKGEQPFDLAAAQKVFATFADAATKMPDLFPDNSRTGEDTAALPKIWEDMADFKARFVKFGEDAKTAQASVKDLDGFKVAFANIGRNDCGGCHQLYRAKPKS